MIGSRVFIGRNTILSCKNGDIELGDGANIGFNCEIFSASRVRIGANALLAAYCYVIGGDHDFGDRSRPVIEQVRKSAGVTVGDGAWLGAGAKILDGVDIGANAVIGAGAVVRGVGSGRSDRRGRSGAHREGATMTALEAGFACCRCATTSGGKARACTA